MIKCVDIFNKSYDRVHKNLRQTSEFYDYFYGNFLAMAPKIPEVFLDSDMSRLKIMLKDSLIHMKEFFATKQSSDHLINLAKLHSRSQKNINPEYYDYWLGALIEAVKTYDTDFNNKIELSWRIVMAPGIAFMKYSYDNDIST